MTPKEKARELVCLFIPKIIEINPVSDYFEEAKECALICVDNIILSNPHSNPFNTKQYSTMLYWQEVKQEINKL